MANFLNRIMPLLRTQIETLVVGGHASTAGVMVVGQCDLSGNLRVNATRAYETVVFNAPAAGVKAAVTTAAWTRGIVKSVEASLTAGAVNAALVTVQLLENLSIGGPVVLWETNLAAVAGSTARVSLTGLNWLDDGNALATSFTLQFIAAGAATDTQSVSLSYYDPVAQ